MRVSALYISEGHNYVGHHGGPSSSFSIIEKESLECIAGRGIRGDRFFDYKPDFKGQITFFSKEVGIRLFQHLQMTTIDLKLLRRNVILEGVDLNTWIDQEFEIQGVRFRGIEECRPCYWMNQAVGAGAEDFLKGQGGLRAKILTSGLIQK